MDESPPVPRRDPLGRVVATERRPNTPHEFHFWTALDAAVGIGTIVRVEGDACSMNGQIPRVYGVVVEAFGYTDLQSPLHDVLGTTGLRPSWRSHRRSERRSALHSGRPSSDPRGANATGSHG